MTEHVLITGDIHHTGIKKLQERYTVEQQRPDTEDELIQILHNKDGVVNLAHTEITRNVIEHTQLEAISNHCVGYDNVDVDAATEHNIPVTNTPVSHESVADHAFALLLAVAKRVVDGDNYIRNGKYTHNEILQLPGRDVHDKTLAIIGLGRIGQAIAERALGFNMNVTYHDIQRYHDFEEQHDITYKERKPALTSADYIITTLPLNDATHHYFTRETFQHMRDAYFINVGRGAVVDEHALTTALENDTLNGAGLDVFEHEPDISQALLEQDNVVVTPHIASDTVENRKRMAVTAADNLTTMLNGETPEYQVNTTR